MIINPNQLHKELQAAGIAISGCGEDGSVWDIENNDIRERADVKVILSAHVAIPIPKIPTEVLFDLPISAPDFIVSTPKINADPEKALDDAITEMEKGEGNPKSIALITLSIAKYLKTKKGKLK